jgi:hypothetical protein
MTQVVGNTGWKSGSQATYPPRSYAGRTSENPLGAKFGESPLHALGRIGLRSGPRPRSDNEKEPKTDMSERPSFWQRIFGGAEASSLSQRQQKVMRHLVERMDKGEVPLQQALREDYVRRNLSRDEVRQIVSHPEFVQAARERLGESFRSEEFRI